MRVLKIKLNDSVKKNIPVEYNTGVGCDLGGNTIVLSSDTGSGWYIGQTDCEILEVLWEGNSHSSTKSNYSGSKNFSLKELANKMLELEEHLSKVSVSLD